ncbi:MAG: glycosyltransferase [Verrucomicrobia bacterium]|nr:MAG: glycosyltransferase [Verrucomicrobiota bacterium]
MSRLHSELSSLSTQRSTPGGSTGPNRRPLPSVCFAPYAEDNPYQRKLADAIRRQGWLVTTRTPAERLGGFVRENSGERRKCDLLHMHWLPKFGFNRLIESFSAHTVQFLRLRRMGYPWVWTVHDLYDPEARWRSVDRMLARLVFHGARSVLVHSRAAAETVCREFGASDRSKVHVVPHANYIGTYPNNLSRGEARAALSLPENARVFLFFGAIRRYKGVPDLIDAFRRLPHADARLVIAGKPWDTALHREIAATTARDRRIQIHAEFVPDDKVQVYLNACDAVVLPYRDYLTSGAVVLAMSFARACIVPARGSMAEALGPEGGLFYDPDQPDALHEALARACTEHERLASIGRLNHETAARWGWDEMAAATIKAYQAALCATTGDPLA